MENKKLVELDDNFIETRKLLNKHLLKKYILVYALENCISNVEKKNLSEIEIECITNRAYTFNTTNKNFMLYQSNNFETSFPIYDELID